MRTKARMISTLSIAARSLLSTLESIVTPCSVKNVGGRATQLLPSLDEDTSISSLAQRSSDEDSEVIEMNDYFVRSLSNAEISTHTVATIAIHDPRLTADKSTPDFA